MVLGDRSLNVRIASPSPFIKRDNSEIVDVDLPAPVEVLDLCARLGLDYGKVDYVVHHGEVVILDANRTVGHPGNANTGERQAVDFAAGIWSLMAE